MSAIQLAETLDQLHGLGSAFISEAERVVTVSNLTTDAARSVAGQCAALGWNCDIQDSEQTSWAGETLSAAFEPFRVVISKPTQNTGELYILTNVGFSRWLKEGHQANRWKVARLMGVIETKARIIESWRDCAAFDPSPEMKSPRLLVREFSAVRVVPVDIRPWLWKKWDTDFFENSAFNVWANAAVRALLVSLADEVSHEDSFIKFRGPPKLSLTLPADTEDALVALGGDGLVSLQLAAAWVFENEHDAEMRHIFFATELARSAVSEAGLFSFLTANLEAALDGAKIAYQMSLADISKDTIKALADLRKAVTDETAKLSDMTRQLVAALASALAVGLGLIAARVATVTPTPLIAAILGVVVVYVVVIVLSGRDFIRIQSDLRRDWQARIYRFLPDKDYTKMVSEPVANAERSFYLAAKIGGGAIFVLVLVFVGVSVSNP